MFQQQHCSGAEVLHHVYLLKAHVMSNSTIAASWLCSVLQHLKVNKDEHKNKNNN